MTSSYITGVIIFYRYGQNQAIIGAVETGNVPIAKLEKHSVRIACSNCQMENFTRVKGKISGNGMMWAICCCCFGSWLLSLLVLCMDVFREFTHYCPSCNSIAGKYRPPLSGGLICLFILIAVGVIASEILFFALFFIPLMQHWRDPEHYRNPYRG